MDPIKTVNLKIKDRKPLHILQPAATDNETLVGADRILKSSKSKGAKTKQDVTEIVKKDASTFTKIIKKSKAVQTVQEEQLQVQAEDLTKDNPNKNYWQILARRKQMILVNTLEENKELVQRIKKLEEENQVCKELVDEMKIFVEVLQEQIEDDRNDDVSHRE